MVYLVDAGAQVTEWVAKQLGFDGGIYPSYSIGIVDDGKLIGGVVYHNFTVNNIEMSIATISPKWAGRGIIRQLLAYPYSLGCERITAIADSENHKSRKLLEKLGFQLEGVLRKGSPFRNRRDAAVYGLLKEEFEQGKYGKICTKKS